MGSRAARSRPRSMTLFPPPHSNVLVASDPALCDSKATAIYIHNRPIRTLIARIPSPDAVLQAPAQVRKMPRIPSLHVQKAATAI